MNPFFETEGVYKINGLIFDVKNTCFDYCVCEFSCISSERINFQELCVNILVNTVYKYFKYCATEEKLFPIQPFHYISFPENFTDSRMESRSSLASQKYPLGNKANSLNPCFFFPFAVSASCIISSTNANKTINDFSLFTNRFLLISSVTNVSKMTFPILKVTLLLHKLAQH